MNDEKKATELGREREDEFDRLGAGVVPLHREREAVALEAVGFARPAARARGGACRFTSSDPQSVARRAAMEDNRARLRAANGGRIPSRLPGRVEELPPAPTKEKAATDAE